MSAHERFYGAKTIELRAKGSAMNIESEIRSDNLSFTDYDIFINFKGRDWIFSFLFDKEKKEYSKISNALWAKEKSCESFEDVELDSVNEDVLNAAQKERKRIILKGGI